MDIPAEAGRFSALSSHPMAKGSTALRAWVLAQDPPCICEAASIFFFLLETYFLSACRENCYWYAENSLLSYSVVTWQPTLVLVPVAGGQRGSVAQRQRGCLPRAGEARRLPFSPLAMHALCGLRAFVAILELVAEWCLALAKTQEK